MDRRTFLGIGTAGIAATRLTALAAENAMNSPAGLLKIDTGYPLPDPCCIHWDGAWYLTGTNHRDNRKGLLYDLYRSTDLKTWTFLGGMLTRPEYEGSDRANYWAPEIMPHSGKFYLYYTADSNGDPYMRFIRLGVADRIEGPYLDQGVTLTAQTSIDANPNWFGDQGWMFFTGNEGNDNMGQVMVDRLITPMQPAGEPRRAFPDGDVEWEEGAFLVPHQGKYYLFTSMGNWRDGSYHILLSVADTPDGPYRRIMDGDKPYVLLASRGELLGPGHNSVFAGPGGRLWLCFHAWDQAHTGRYPWLAPLSFAYGRFEVDF